MDKVASEMMGEPVTAGSVCQSKGTGAKMAVGMMTAGVAGVAGQMMAESAMNKRKAATTPGDYKGLMYVAVGPASIGFFSVKRGLIKNSIKELLHKAPRGSVESFDVGGGMATSALTVAFRDGTSYELEVPRAFKGKATKVKQALGV